MGKYSIHTNIALDYPTIWTGSIYASDNVEELFSRVEFIDKIINEELVGTVGFREIKKLPANMVSHVVIDAYVTEDKEIMFDIRTLGGQAGRKLDILLEQDATAYLAKIVATIDLDKSKDGIVNLVDIRYVHIDEK